MATPEDYAKAMDSPIIGKREYVSLPDWGIDRIDAKIDTGAEISAIDVEMIEIIDEDTIKFLIMVNEEKHEITDKVAYTKEIKSSNGDKEKRFVINTALKIGDTEVKGDISLADRKDMELKLLVGEDTLKNFMVDPSIEYSA